MLYAIFFLLLIAFFPILSLVLGIGIVALVANYWWVILLIVSLPALIKFLDKTYQSSSANTKSQNHNHAGEINSKGMKKPYAGDANLSNDSYIIYLTKKYAIERNDVLGKYILNDKLYGSIDEALKCSSQIEETEQERISQDIALREREKEKEHREIVANIKKIIGLLVVTLITIVSIKMLYFAKDSSDPELSNQELCEHFLGEEAYDKERGKFLEESIKKYCPSGTLPYWKQPNYGK